jgi:hypothetical protein
MFILLTVHQISEMGYVARMISRSRLLGGTNAILSIKADGRSTSWNNFYLRGFHLL